MTTEYEKRSRWSLLIQEKLHDQDGLNDAMFEMSYTAAFVWKKNFLFSTVYLIAGIKYKLSRWMSFYLELLNLIVELITKYTIII